MLARGYPAGWASCSLELCSRTAPQHLGRRGLQEADLCLGLGGKRKLQIECVAIWAEEEERFLDVRMER